MFFFFFSKTKIVFQNLVPKHKFSFLETPKFVLKNCFPEQFSKTTTKKALSFLGYEVPQDLEHLLFT